jgi:hypothetical protein
MISFRLNKVRAHRVLVVIRPAGDGLAAPLAVATQWRTGRRKKFASRGICAAEGKLFSPDGCSHEARGSAAPPPGFTTTQGRLGLTPPNPKGAMASSASPHEGIKGTPLTRARPFPNDWQESAPSTQAAMREARGGAPSKAEPRIREPSFVTHRQRTASVEDGTHSHNLPQQAPAYPPSTAHAVARWSGRSGAAGSAHH